MVKKPQPLYERAPKLSHDLEARIHRGNLIFWAVWSAVFGGGIGFAIGRWPDVVARICSSFGGV